MKKNILVYSRVTPEMTKKYEGQYSFTFMDGSADGFREKLAAEIANFHGLVGANVHLDDEVLKQASCLEAIATVSVGYDKYDLDALARHGITLTNTPDVLTETTADLAFTLLMCSARRVVELDRWVKGGHWDHVVGEAEFGVDIHNKKIGIIGMGRIGTAIARRAHCGFGMEVLYCGQERKEDVEDELGAKFLTLYELLSEADFVLPVVPLTPDTRGLISHREFGLMKKTAILVNASRGPIVDENALFSALTEGEIFAAGLDVYQREPLQSSALFELPNLVTVPHIGSATRETRDEMAMYALDSLVSVLEGGRPNNIVDLG